MSGANSLSEALELQNQLTQILSSAGLLLKKWASNGNELLNSIDSDMCLSNASLNIDNYDTEGLVIFSDSKSAIEAIRNGETNISCDIITLLEQLHNKRKSCILQWIPAHVNIEGPLTKRTLLSTIAKTFDPLGWLSPFTTQYKTIGQRLWKQQLQGDERVPSDITLEWEQLAKDVQLVKDIKIPRFLFVDSDNQFHLFGFSDASEKAYVALFQIQKKSTFN
ncbi:uncharacterized protein TNCV_3315501 [Trichonephila clavipes]|nr:uncharacterized protein TNCV_3315501 [Trichonephila clavipes]